jgi:HEAT repeat protein
MRFISSAIVAIVLSANAHGYSAAQTAKEVQQLFVQLQDAKTSNDAAVRLKILAESSAEARQYLVDQLPGIITTSQPQIWENSVWRNSLRLVGDLKIVETVPILVKLLDSENRGGPVTIGMQEDLDTDPVGQALVKIGEPALGPVRSVLENKDKSQSVRLRAVHILYNMNSIDADQALSQHLQSEGDPRVKASIQWRLQMRKKTTNH